MTTLIDHCILGIVANREQCKDELERSIGVVTALCPHIGYAAACGLAKEALATNTPLRQLVLSRGLLTKEQAEDVLNPMKMTDWKK